MNYFHVIRQTKTNNYAIVLTSTLSQAIGKWETGQRLSLRYENSRVERPV